MILLRQVTNIVNTICAIADQNAGREKVCISTAWRAPAQVVADKFLMQGQ